jgi:hypothetical protein
MNDPRVAADIPAKMHYHGHALAYYLDMAGQSFFDVRQVLQPRGSRLVSLLGHPGVVVTLDTEDFYCSRSLKVAQLPSVAWTPHQNAAFLSISRKYSIRLLYMGIGMNHSVITSLLIPVILKGTKVSIGAYRNVGEKTNLRTGDIV